jgi:polyisoprenoid-binding protein YceI
MRAALVFLLTLNVAASGPTLSGRSESNGPPPVAASSYHVDPANSRLTIHVGKAGAFSFIAGHTHNVSGPIDSGEVEFDPDHASLSRIHIVIAASALKVQSEGEPRDDVPKVQAAMESNKVLDIARYPRITFESTAVTVTGRRDTTLDLMVAGRMTIRDVTQAITVPVHADVRGDTITATGRFELKQTAYGITPITVAGVVSVKDALDIRFSIVARR